MTETVLEKKGGSVITILEEMLKRIREDGLTMHLTAGRPGKLRCKFCLQGLLPALHPRPCRINEKPRLQGECAA